MLKTFLKTHSSFLWPHTGGKGTLQDSVSTTLTLNYPCYNLCPSRGWTVANGPSQGWIWTSVLVLNVQNGYFEWAASVCWGFKKLILLICSQMVMIIVVLCSGNGGPWRAHFSNTAARVLRRGIELSAGISKWEGKDPKANHWAFQLSRSSGETMRLHFNDLE